MRGTVAVWVVIIVSPVIAEGPSVSEFKSLYQAHRWSELYDALQAHKGPLLYRGVIAAVFNDNRNAERLLQSVIRSTPHSDDAYDAYEWLAHIDFRSGRYHSFIADMENR